MVVIDLVEEAKKLMAERDEIDRKISQNVAVLEKNKVDMTTPLVDDEGYPSVTIDVISVRKARHEIICLRNDREEIMSKIAKALEKVHESPSSSQVDVNTDEPTVHRTSNKPFVQINSVEPNSPAEKAGLKRGDLIIQMGNLHADIFQGFGQLKECVQNSINGVVKVTVFRPNSPTNRVFRLELRPQCWEGAGVLGCTFSTVEKDNNI